MKLLIIVLYFLWTVSFAQGIPSPVSTGASSPVTGLTTTGGQAVTINQGAASAPPRPNNTSAGVFNMPPTLAFKVNYKAIPKGKPGIDKLVIVTSTDPNTASEHSDAGDFRTSCYVRGMYRFDPLVYPGQKEAGHLHVFMGNGSLVGTLTEETLGDLAKFGTSTCSGGWANRSAYWVPALIDTRTGFPVLPYENEVYYKNAYTTVRSQTPEVVVVPPPGLRMIKGDPNASGPGEGHGFQCFGPGGQPGWDHIPTANELAAVPDACKDTDIFQMGVRFQRCWDGVNLDSPGHQAHVAEEDPTNGCPSTHPKYLPQIDYNIRYSIKAIGGRSNIPNLRLSSDNYSTSIPGGYSAHGDWINGWNQAVMTSFVQNCLRLKVNCHNDVLDRPETVPHRILGKP